MRTLQESEDFGTMISPVFAASDASPFTPTVFRAHFAREVYCTCGGGLLALPEAISRSPLLLVPLVPFIITTSHQSLMLLKLLGCSFLVYLLVARFFSWL